MDAPEHPLPDPDLGDLSLAEEASAMEEPATEQGPLGEDPFQELAQPLESAEQEPAPGKIPGGESGGEAGVDASQSQRVLPLAEASYLAGVSVQALRQRIKRGTLPGTDAVDSRGQSVAGVSVLDLQAAFPQRCFDLAGASQSNPVGARGSTGKPSRGPNGDFLFGEAVGQAWDTDPGLLGTGDPWDPQADLERGGMAPSPSAGPVPQIDPSGFPAARRQTAQGFGVGLWGIALIVALAAVGVAGLLTGAREARAASRGLDTAYQREILLIEELKAARKERDLALARAESLAQELKRVDRAIPASGH